MNLRDLNRKEKAAILKTLITIAGADNRLSYSENTFLSMFLMEINEDKSFFNYLDNISSSETIEIVDETTEYWKLEEFISIIK